MRFFFYGTLLDSDVAALVLGRRLPPAAFMPASLLESQLATLEPPGRDENPIAISVDQPIELIVGRIVGVLFPPAQSRSDFGQI